MKSSNIITECFYFVEMPQIILMNLTCAFCYISDLDSSFFIAN